MNETTDGGPAFPSHGTMGEVAHEGMSLRDYLAAKAIPTASKWEEERPTGPYRERMEPTYAGIATRAYLLADAMLKAKNQ